MSVLIQTRRAKAPHPCASCNGVILSGEEHHRKTAKVDGKYVSSREHIVCPEPERRFDWVALALIVAGVVAALILIASYWRGL